MTCCVSLVKLDSVQSQDSKSETGQGGSRAGTVVAVQGREEDVRQVRRELGLWLV